MNFDEFKTWLKSHTRKFPNVDVFLNNLKSRKTEVTREWFRLLSNIELQDAINATERMYDGEKSRNEFPQNHPAKIREMVSGISMGRAEADAEKCVCGGSGFLDVKNEPGYFKTPMGNVITADCVTVACKCAKGNWVRQKHEEAHSLQPNDRPPPIVQYDPSWMTVYDEYLRQRAKGVIIVRPEPVKALADGWGGLPDYQASLYDNPTREPGGDDE